MSIASKAKGMKVQKVCRVITVSNEEQPNGHFSSKTRMRAMKANRYR